MNDTPPAYSTKAAAQAICCNLLLATSLVFATPKPTEPTLEPPGSANGNVPPPAGLSIQNGLISFTARNDSLLAILEALSRHFGFVIISRIPDNRMITLTIRHRPVKEAVALLTAFENTAIVFNDTGTDLKQLILLSKPESAAPVTAAPRTVFAPLEVPYDEIEMEYLDSHDDNH